MAFNSNDLTITSLETITGIGLSGDVAGQVLFVLDELQNATIGQTQDEEEITGKQGRRLATLKRNKAVTVSGTNGLVSGGLMAIQTGGEFEAKESTEVGVTEYLAVSGNAATTTNKAVGTAGNEIGFVYVRDTDNTIKATLEQAATAAEGKFAYDPATKKITFAEGAIEDGSTIVVFYKRNVAGTVLENYSDQYSGKCALYIDAFAEDKCANTYRIQFYIPKADFNGEFEIEMGDSQAVHAFEAQSLSGACGVGTTGDVLWVYTVFDSDAADAA